MLNGRFAAYAASCPVGWGVRAVDWGIYGYEMRCVDPSLPPPAPPPPPAPSPDPEPSNPGQGGNASRSRTHALRLSARFDVSVRLTGMTSGFDCRVGRSDCTNRSGTADDSWSGALDTSERNVSTSRTYSFALATPARVDVALTGLTIDFDCRVGGSRCTNRWGTRDDSWSGDLGEGNHSVVVYSYDPGPGNYSLTVTATTTRGVVTTPMGVGPGDVVCDQEGEVVDEDSCTRIPEGGVFTVTGDDPGDDTGDDQGPPPGAGPGEGNPGPGDGGGGGGGGGTAPSWPQSMMPQSLRNAVADAIARAATCSVTTRRLGTVSAYADLTAVRDAEQIVPGGSQPACNGERPVLAEVDAIPGTTIYIHMPSVLYPIRGRHVLDDHARGVALERRSP